MALKLYDKLTPSGNFALIDTAHVELPDGRRLNEIEFGSGGGLSTEATRLLITILNAGTYVSDQSENIKALEALLCGAPTEPDAPDNPETVKLFTPVIRLETIEQKEKLETPVIRLGTTSGDGGETENTPAILGSAVLGRTILGKTDGTILPKLSSPVIHLETDEQLVKLGAPTIRMITVAGGENDDRPKLSAPMIRIETVTDGGAGGEEAPGELPKLVSPVIYFEPDPEEIPKLTAPVIYLESLTEPEPEELPKLGTPTIYLGADEELPKLKRPIIYPTYIA